MSARPGIVRVLSLVLGGALLLILAAGCLPNTKKAASGYAGKYKGRGASEEVRFRKQGILTLTVKHQVEFAFKIDEQGNVVGDGTITYNLDRNTEGLDSLVASVRSAMNIVPGVGGAVGAVSKEAKEVASGIDTGEKILGKNSPGKLSYDAPHLKHGPEIRYFNIKGKVDTTTLADGAGQELRLTLAVDGDFKRPDGKVDSDLIAQWEVNGVKEEKSFPCWSPFLDGFGVLKKGEGGTWTADFSKKGEHRENNGKPVKVWEEYGYYWLAQQKDW